MKRRSPIKPRSAKGEAYQQEYLEASHRVAERSGGLCEIRAEHPCTGAASLYPHHRKLRSQGGSNDPDRNLLDCCPRGHDWIHALPRLKAYDLQLIIPRDQDEYPYDPPI